MVRAAQSCAVAQARQPLKPIKVGKSRKKIGRRRGSHRPYSTTGSWDATGFQRTHVSGGGATLPDTQATPAHPPALPERPWKPTAPMPPSQFRCQASKAVESITCHHSMGLLSQIGTPLLCHFKTCRLKLLDFASKNHVPAWPVACGLQPIAKNYCNRLYLHSRITSTAGPGIRLRDDSLSGPVLLQPCRLEAGK